MLLALVLLLAQAAPALEFVGPLEFFDSRGRMIIPTKAALTVKDRTITGLWQSTTGTSSGPIAGTVDDKGKVTLSVTLYGGAETDGANGAPEILAPERCRGEATFKGEILRNRVIRVTAPVLRLNTAHTRATERDCENLTRLVWVLQPAR